MEEATRSFTKPLARDTVPAGWNSVRGGFACGFRSFGLIPNMTEFTGNALPAIALPPMLAHFFGLGSFPPMLLIMVHLDIAWTAELFTTFWAVAFFLRACASLYMSFQPLVGK
jgi:hypothetical protein